MITKQAMLGIGLMVGGAVTVTALLLQPKESPKPVDMPISSQGVKSVPVTSDPLTVDAQTETRILQEKQKQRQAMVEEAQARTNALLAQQEAAKALALQKAKEEAQIEEEVIASNLKVETRPEAIALAEQQKREREQREREQREQQKREEQRKERERQEALARQQKATQNDKTKENKEVKDTKAQAPKPKAEPKPAKPDTKAQAQDKKAETKNVEAKKTEVKKETAQKKPEPKTTPKTHVVQAGDTLIRLSKEYGIPVSAIAEANNMGRHDPLQRGRTIKLPTASEIKTLQEKAQKRQQERIAKEQAEQKKRQLDEKLADARKEAKRQGGNESYAVQVALATDQAKANALVNTYKKAGYKVRTETERRGVRVIVGSERSREAATILKDKLKSDPSVPADGAWVIKTK